MSQLEKAKEAVERTRETWLGAHAHAAAVECLLSIAISLDEKNKFDRETRAKDDERMKESYDQSERMVKKVEEFQEAQRMQSEPPNPKRYCHCCGEELDEISAMANLQNTSHGKSL